MRAIRELVEREYNKRKKDFFEKTQEDPEVAHEELVALSQRIGKFGSKLLLNHPDIYKNPGFSISNAAGFNKNGDIHPALLQYLGFDRNVIGTVTADPWEGNPRPRIKRYPETETLVNWAGLPGIGCEAVAENLENYGLSKLPQTINVMATPGKKGEEAIADVKRTIQTFKGFPQIDRIELNISCPNTHSSSGKIDARREYMEGLESMLQAIDLLVLQGGSDLALKVSPDLTPIDIETTIETASRFKIVRYIVNGNTTTEHDPIYISESPGKGGASGNAVYPGSLNTQETFENLLDKVDSDIQIIACGGINSYERAQKRTANKRTNEIQIFTPLIFKGPELLRKIKTRKYAA